MSTNLIIALIAICLFFSALLSGSETAITYVPREKIHQLSDSKRNKKIKNAKDELEKTIGIEDSRSWDSLNISSKKIRLFKTLFL